MRASLLRTMLPLTLAACAVDVGITEKDPDPPDPVDTDIVIPVSQPDIEVTPAELSFGELPPNCPAAPQEIVIKNVGDARLDVSSIALDGAGNAVFTVNKGGPIKIGPGDQVKVEVGFTATDYLNYNKVKVVVTSKDPDEDIVKVPVLGEGSVAAFAEDLFIQESASSVDVLWVVDNSCSMADDIQRLTNVMDVFFQGFVNLGLDYHVGVTTTDTTCAGVGAPANGEGCNGKMIDMVIDSTTPDPAGAFSDMMDLAVSWEGDANERGFGAAKAALIAPAVNSAPNNAFLRSDATLAVVVLSDEDDADALTGGNRVTDAFTSWLQGRKADPDDVTFSGMVGPRSGSAISGCPAGSQGSASAAPQYHRAIGTTRGVWGSMCNFDIAPFLTHLSFVAAGLEYRFELTQTPVNTSGQAITVTVDGENIPLGRLNDLGGGRVGGWTYDSTNNVIELHGSAIPDPGEDVVIRYPYDSGC